MGKTQSKDHLFRNPVVIAALITGIFALMVTVISNLDKIGWNKPKQSVRTAVPSNQNLSSTPSPTVSNSNNSQSIGDIKAGRDVNIRQEMDVNHK